MFTHLGQLIYSEPCISEMEKNAKSLPGAAPHHGIGRRNFTELQKHHVIGHRGFPDQGTHHPEEYSNLLHPNSMGLDKGAAGPFQNISFPADFQIPTPSVPGAQQVRSR